MDLTRHTAVRYVLFQIPATALLILVLAGLRKWLDLSWTTIWVLTGLWVLKDVALYPLVRRAYDPSRGDVDLAGRLAVAVEPLAPDGFVRLGGELWKAEIWDPERPVAAGAKVRVVRRRGLTLVVMPEGEEPPGDTGRG